ncbi:hypothetical protein GTU99_35485 [Streptomyces sp. PRKS01-65]|nr:hypothetical protein [Streptomyces harenosi]
MTFGLKLRFEGFSHKGSVFNEKYVFAHVTQHGNLTTGRQAHTYRRSGNRSSSYPGMFIALIGQL